MPIRLTSTKKEAELHGVKCLVYGLAGTGKTTLCSTAPAPLIISNESGLLSLRHVDIPVIAIKSYDDLQEAYNFVNESADAKSFETICLDSISEIAEVVLAHEKGQTKDARAAYGELQVKTLALCRAFRDLAERHVYLTCKQARVQNDQGVFINTPSLPGTKLPQELPYLFDEVLCLRSEKNEEGETVRWLQTQPSLQYIAKDRSGALDEFEKPDLSSIFSKITNVNEE